MASARLGLGHRAESPDLAAEHRVDALDDGVAPGFVDRLREGGEELLLHAPCPLHRHAEREAGVHQDEVRVDLGEEGEGESSGGDDRDRDHEHADADRDGRVSLAGRQPRHRPVGVRDEPLEALAEAATRRAGDPPEEARLRGVREVGGQDEQRLDQGEMNTLIATAGICMKSFPLAPGTKSIGANATMFVRTAKVIGAVIWRAPAIAASRAGMPCSRLA